MAKRPATPVPTQTQRRDSENGQWTTKKYADAHPKTTETERVKHPERADD